MLIPQIFPFARVFMTISVACLFVVICWQQQRLIGINLKAIMITLNNIFIATDYWFNIYPIIFSILSDFF